MYSARDERRAVRLVPAGLFVSCSWAVLVRRAKIVCTIGPASESPSTLVELVRSGMDVARLNFSHGSHDEHGRRAAAVRAAAEQAGRPVAILQDLCGPKIRCGCFPKAAANAENPSKKGGTLDVAPGENVDLVEVESERAMAPAREGGPSQIPINYTGLAEDLRPDDEILLDDGRVSVKVIERADNSRVRAVVKNGGQLRDRCGVHIPSRRVRISALTEKDKSDLAFGLSIGVDYVALSFVRTADDIRLVRDITEAWGQPTPIVAKIETPQAIDNLEDILHVTDAVMVARGDLGVELAPEQVPILQREILGMARVHQRPVIVATEMLQSMVTETRPTRAEASDVATAVYDGTDAVMLSQETATGNHPALVVEMMARIIREAEASRFYRPLSSKAHTDAAGSLWDRTREPQPSKVARQRAAVAEAIARSAAEIARQIEARVIVAFTETGLTARYVSKARPTVPIITFSPNPATCRRLALLWGVTAFPFGAMRHPDEMMDRANGFLLANGLASPGDKFVAMFGAPVGVVGSTNSIRVRVVE
ncbi:MAG: pyruvate kinase [Polyangiaceae bacterium]|nr:pyruvate kinase [Polyangiaceae bacterium]